MVCLFIFSYLLARVEQTPQASNFVFSLVNGGRIASIPMPNFRVTTIPLAWVSKRLQTGYVVFTTANSSFVSAVFPLSDPARVTYRGNVLVAAGHDPATNITVYDSVGLVVYTRLPSLCASSLAAFRFSATAVGDHEVPFEKSFIIKIIFKFV